MRGVLLIAVLMLPSLGTLPASAVGPDPVDPTLPGGVACRAGVSRFSVPLSTGQFDGKLLEDDEMDRLWRLTAAPGSTTPVLPAYVHDRTGGLETVWVADPASAWINHDPHFTSGLQGDYVYLLAYAVPPGAFNVRLVGRFSGDNHVELLEGPPGAAVSAGPAQVDAFRRWTDFSFSVAPGARELRALVHNEPWLGKGTYTGLNVVATLKGECAPGEGSGARVGFPGTLR